MTNKITPTVSTDEQQQYRQNLAIQTLTRVVQMQREPLAANRTYYVATTGSDTNNGLSDSTPFLTIQKAVNVIAADLDLNGYTATVQVADGTYTGAVTLKNVAGFSTAGDVIIQGNSSTPTNVVVSITGGTCFSATDLATAWRLKDMQLTTTGAGTQCIHAIRSHVEFSGLDFGAVGQSHLTSQRQAAIEATGNYTISGGGLGHATATEQGFIILINRTVTISNTPAFSGAFARCPATGGGSVIRAGNMTFSGTGATGSRYTVALNSVIDTAGGGATYFPGNAVGTAVTGGQYA